jgi:hypothetical protein
MRRFRNVLRHWLQSAFLIVVTCGLIYVVAQQAYRWNANDPQIQMAEDGAIALSQGVTPESLAPQMNINLEQSLAPFIMVVDDTGKVLFSSGTINGKPPILPFGVLEYTRNKGEDRITWAIQENNRFAAVIRRFEGATAGFIVVARSLREVQNRISTIYQLMVGATVAAMMVSFVVTYLAEVLFRHSHHHRGSQAEEEEEV